MAAKKQIAQQVSDAQWRELAPKVWDILPEGIYEWEISATARVRLEGIVGRLEHDTSALTALERNQDIRDRLAPAISAADPARLYDLAAWIIKDWGGISGGRRSDDVDPLKLWSEALHGFGSDQITAFVQAQGNKRVSSWSKLLAFADASTYAIYDTRVAVTLNIALKALGDERRFHLPQGRNDIVARAAAVLGKARDPLGYLDYLAFLRAVVTQREQTFLSAETRLFAIAPQLAESFMDVLAGYANQAARAALRLDDDPT